MAPDGYLLVVNYPLIFSPNPRELDDCATGIDDRGFRRGHAPEFYGKTPFVPRVRRRIGFTCG